MKRNWVYFVFHNINTENKYDGLQWRMFATGQISGMTLKLPTVVVCPKHDAELLHVRHNAKVFLEAFPDCAVTERS